MIKLILIVLVVANFAYSQEEGKLIDHFNYD